MPQVMEAAKKVTALEATCARLIGERDAARRQVAEASSAAQAADSEVWGVGGTRGRQAGQRQKGGERGGTCDPCGVRAGSLLQRSLSCSPFRHEPSATVAAGQGGADCCEGQQRRAVPHGGPTDEPGAQTPLLFGRGPASMPAARFFTQQHLPVSSASRCAPACFARWPQSSRRALASAHCWPSLVLPEGED